MGFLRNYTGSNTLKLYISATSNSKVKLTIPLQGYSDSILIPKDSVRIIVVPNNLGNITVYDSVMKNAIRITSDNPVSVAAMNLQAATTDASIVLPTVNIPPASTYILGCPTTSGLNNEAMMVSSSDSAIITIIPTTTTTGGHMLNVPYNIRLNKGELYQIAATSLTGSVIKVKNNAKVAVFSGDYCSNWPCGACDHQYEQIMPNQLVDTSYYVPPHFGHTGGYSIKIVPVDSNISVTANGVTYNNLSRLTPLAINVKADSGYYIKSNKLFHVFQFLKGPSCNGYITSNYGDPSMLEILSNKYMGQSSIFSTVNSTNLRDHFVSIVINTASKNNVYFDKTKIDSSEFKPFPYDSKRSYACLKINLGTHLVECSDGMLAYCYGIGFYESYLYLAGFNLPNFDLDFQDSVVQYDCKDQRIKMQFKAKTSKVLKKYTWYFGDGTSGTGNPILHLYDTIGMIKVKLVGEDFSGKKDSVTKLIRVDWPVFDPVRNKIICGIDTVTFQERNPFFSNFKWQDSSTNNYYKAWDNKRIWVYATDTSGYCKFIDTGVVGKIGVFTALRVDSLEKCFRNNLFRFKDSTNVLVDQIDHKAWVFPFATYWDQSTIDVKFPMPGKYKVYFDVYTKQVNCKARYPIDVTVHPNPKAYTNHYGDFYCTGTNIQFKDSSQIVTGSIDSVKWLFDDNTIVKIDSSNTYKKFQYDPSTGNVTRHYNQVPISDHHCTDTAKSAVNIWPAPVAAFSIINPDTIRCLPSARWTFSSSTKTYYDTFSLRWDAGNGVKGTQKDLKNVRYTSPGIYKIKLTATETQYGCVDSVVKHVEVLKVPQARILIPDTIQCAGNNSFVFKDSSDGKYLKAQWKIDSGYSDTNHLISNYHFSQPGRFKVRLTVYNGYTGCTDDDSLYVHVVRNPKAAYTVNNDTQCLKGNSFTFNNTSKFYQKYSTTDWTLKAPTVSAADTNFSIFNFNATDTGDYKITLIVRDEEACTDTTFGLIRVNSHTKSTLSINDDIQCQDSNRFVFRTVIGNKETRDWKIDQVLVQSGNIDSLVKTISTAGQHSITVVGKNNTGCSDSTSSTFKVLASPVAAFKTDNDTQCLRGHVFNLSDASTAAGDVINSWTYTVNDTLVRNSTGISNIRFSKDGRYKVVLNIQTQENCKDTAIDYLTVLPLPTYRLIGDTVCLGDTARIKAQGTGTTTLKTLKWQLGDGDSSTGANVHHLYNAINSYNLRLAVTDQYGCRDTQSANGAVIIRPLPDATYYTDVQDFGINQVKLKFIPNNLGYTQYLWLFPDGSQSAKDTPSFIITDIFKGNSKLIVTNQYGCVDSSDKYQYVYPNNFNVYIPSAISLNGDLLNDVFKPVGLGATKTYSMRIYNRWGEEIFFTEDPDKGWDGTYMNALVMQDTYTYLIEFTFIDGKFYRFKGTLTVLR